VMECDHPALQAARRIDLIAQKPHHPDLIDQLDALLGCLNPLRCELSAAKAPGIFVALSKPSRL
jgi:hypothetical protein